MPIRKREFKIGAKWCVDVIFPNGRRYRRVIGTKKQAEKVQRKLESEIVEGKWEIRETEEIPFSTLAIEYLEYSRAHRESHLEYGVQSECVFTYNGHKLRSNIKRSLSRVLKEADLEGVTLHALRHTFASQLVMAGVSLREVQELMGHKSFETTLQYAHLSDDHVKKKVLSTTTMVRRKQWSGRTFMG